MPNFSPILWSALLAALFAFRTLSLICMAVLWTFLSRIGNT